MVDNDCSWIKLYRRFLKSPIWQNSNVRCFWIWCLLKATHDGYSTTIGLKRIALDPGQFLYNHPTASMETGLSLKEVRNCIEFLKGGDDPEIGQTEGRLPGNRYAIITINKWMDYQNTEHHGGRYKTEKKAGQGQTRGSLYYKEGKNVKKHTGVAASNPTENPTWTQWVDACRAAGRKDPAPSSGALLAAKDLTEWFPNVGERRRIMDAYLSLDDPWIRRQGYQLALLTKHRIEAARTRADEMENEPDDLNDPRAIQMALECIEEERARLQQSGGKADVQ